eukprot:gene22647-29326_t
MGKQWYSDRGIPYRRGYLLHGPPGGGKTSDVDAAFPSREARPGRPGGVESAHSHSSDVTFSGLLNVLDGAASSEERLVFMTTNFIDRLDPALIRPGRVDLMQCIDHIMNLYKTFFPEEISEKADEFLVSIRAAYPVISMAALQGHLLMHKNSPATAIQSLSGFQKKSDVTIRSTDSDNDTVPDQVRLTRAQEQVDQMYFNPQPGWDKDIVQIK